MYNYTQLKPGECEFVQIGPANELVNGERWFIDLDGITMVVFNIAGSFYALADVCSHDDGPVGDGELDGFEIVCPRHGAKFDVRDGSVTSLPAVVDIPAYPIRIVDGMLEVGIPNEE